MAVLLVAAIYTLGKTTPSKKTIPLTDNQQHSEDDGHDHGNTKVSITIDTILLMAKKQEQVKKGSFHVIKNPCVSQA